MRQKDFVNGFSEDWAATVTLHQPIRHAIDLEPAFNIQYV